MIKVEANGHAAALAHGMRILPRPLGCKITGAHEYAPNVGTVFAESATKALVCFGDSRSGTYDHVGRVVFEKHHLEITA